MIEQENWEFFNALDSIKRIANHYGLNHQIGKAKEELQELYTALLDYQEDDSKENLKAVITEIADVEIMTAQLKYLLDVKGIADVEIMTAQLKYLLDVKEKVNKEKLYKVNRQLKRMESEKKSNE